MKRQANRIVWNFVSNPIKPDEALPAERRVVLVWLKTQCLPYCGYVRYAAGDKNNPRFIVYHGSTAIGSDVVAWCDCLPDNGPEIDNARVYNQEQANGRGCKARSANRADSKKARGE